MISPVISTERKGTVMGREETDWLTSGVETVLEGISEFGGTI